MQPHPALTFMAGVFVAALVALSARGLTSETVWLAVALIVYASLLDSSYLVRRRRRAMLALPHRRQLDKVVRYQWLCIGILGLTIGLVFEATDFLPLENASILVHSIIFGAVVAISVVYASSLIDWYWVLPRVSGIVSPPPCVRVGGKYYDGVTKVWYLHRATATALFTFVLAGVPAYAAGEATNGTNSTVLTLVGAALAIGYNTVNSGTLHAFSEFLSPVVSVGGFVSLRRKIQDAEPQDAYVVDVAIQGIKYRFVADADGEFIEDGTLLKYHEIDRELVVERKEPVCPSLDQCRAINWYCLRNRNANGEIDPDDRKPAPLPRGAPDR